MKIAYLGPEGTFSQQAVIIYSSEYIKESNPIFVPYQTIDEVIASVNTGKIPIGIVPFENSTEGTVNATLDTLIFDAEVSIIAQLSLKITQNLFIKPADDGLKITKILSHPQGLAQCRKFLQANFAGVLLSPQSSTAEAARIVADSDEPIAAVSNYLAGEIYGLKAVYTDIQDQSENSTTFVVISKTSKETVPDSDNYKTALVFSTLNKPGELYRILDIFSIWDINMTKILSRPMRNRPGEYVFYVDLEGRERDISDGLKMVKRKTGFCKILGSYSI